MTGWEQWRDATRARIQRDRLSVDTAEIIAVDLEPAQVARCACSGGPRRVGFDVGGNLRCGRCDSSLDPVRETVWTLEAALVFVRAYQPRVMGAGWCLMLGGGVLNRGLSINDLDLLAYPRTGDSVRGPVLALFPPGAWSLSPVSDVYHFQHDGKPVELIFQTRPA